MPRGPVKNQDGIYRRKDRPAGSGPHDSIQAPVEKADSETKRLIMLGKALNLLSAEKARVEKTVTLGYAPPSPESFTAVSKRFLKHQKAKTDTPTLQTRRRHYYWPSLMIPRYSKTSRADAASMYRSTSRIAAAINCRLLRP